MWSLYEDNKFLEPLVFSNGKSQEDIVQEVLDVIKQGYKIIFIKGICGSGKSAVALNLAKELGRASIAVPIKTLQKQYEDDYTNKKYILKNNKKLKIQILTGRNNHKCPFTNNSILEEKQTRLFDTYEYKTDSCDAPYLPCKIEIKEKNIHKIREFIRLNPNVHMKDFKSINDVKRMSIAPICPYWSPILPAELKVNLQDATLLTYVGLYDIRYNIYKRKHGCGYYDQFQAYIDADIILFNSQKYKLETLMNRKPATDVEIIDECDEFLDSLSNQKTLNLNRLILALPNLSVINNKITKIVNNIKGLLEDIMKDKETKKAIETEAIIKINKTPILKLLKYFLDNDNLIETLEQDELNYCNICYEIAKTFEDFFEETYISFNLENKDGHNEIIVKLVTINLEKKLKEFLDKNKILIMMSGTIHTPEVLTKIFGITEFKIIEAETKPQGTVTKIRTGYERNFRYSYLKQDILTRGQYLKALLRCIDSAKKPILVHVNSFSDLPTEKEKQYFKLENLITQEYLKEVQEKHKTGELIKEFKQGKTNILFSTKCTRGIDFPGETCNSIILTKYPYPNISSLFWRVLKKVHPDSFWTFYKDKAKREFLQKIYRGLRSKDDHIYLLSPDIQVVNETI